MSISVSVTVSAGTRTTDTTLQNLIRDIQRIKAYDGTTVTVTVEQSHISMIPRPQPLYQVVERMLAEADAAVSPHYRAPPRGLPFALRVQMAMRVFKNESPEFKREAERRSMGVPARNRQEFMLQNPEAFQIFFKTRGALETEFLKELGRSVSSS